MKRLLAGSLIALFAAMALYSCGEKMKLPTEVPPGGNLGDTLYLMINPPWDSQHGYNFSGARAIYFGKDTYLYVADTGNNRILQYDAAGTLHGEFAVDHPISVSQDELMRLLVVSGEKKIYRINVGPNGDRMARLVFDYEHILYSDTTILKHRNMITSSDRFVSITDIPENDKSYFVAVSSDSINNGRVLWFWGSADEREYCDSLFDRKFSDVAADTFSNPVVITGNGITTTTRPNFIYSYEIGNVTHLIVCQDSGSYPVHDMVFQRQVWDRHWVFNYSHNPSDADILSRGFFDRPTGAAVDPQGNIYVVDSGENRGCGAYKFSRQGVLLETMCEPDSVDNMFTAPSGITYDIYGDRRTVFVADTGNNRILRFKLSTDLEP